MRPLAFVYGLRARTIELPGSRETMWYGPAAGGVETPFGSIAVPSGTAQKNGIAIRERKSGEACFSRHDEVAAVDADARDVRLKDAPGEAIFGFATRRSA